MKYKRTQQVIVKASSYQFYIPAKIVNECGINQGDNLVVSMDSDSKKLYYHPDKVIGDLRIEREYSLFSCSSAYALTIPPIYRQYIDKDNPMIYYEIDTKTKTICVEIAK